MKKICLVASLVALSLVLLSSCSTQADYVETQNYELPEQAEAYESKQNYFIGEIAARVGITDYTFTMDFRKFFGDNTTFNEDIAIASVLTISAPFGSISDFMKSMGFTNISPKYAGLMDNDRNRFILGYRRVYYDGEVRDIIMVYVPGIYGLPGWTSNYDIGADSTEYFELTASDHPEWTNRAHHKGHSVTANHVIVTVKDYMDLTNLTMSRQFGRRASPEAAQLQAL